MPRGDKSGPNGQGPMTGRGLGECGSGTNRFVGFGQGRGRRSNRGLARNNRNVQFSNSTTSLDQEKKILEQRLEEINKQLD